MSKKNRNISISKKNYQFIDSAILNDATYLDYLNRFRKIALSMFEWVNLPKSMNSRAIETSLYLYGSAAFLKDENYGFINTKSASAGYINIYGLPTEINCYSYDYQKMKKIYTGLEDINDTDKDKAILVMNNWDMTPTCGSMELFAYRLYEAEQTALINVRAQKTPVMVVVNETQRLMMENLYQQYDGNKPFIFGDKDQLQEGMLKAVKTDAPFIADKIIDYKKEIWNEALTFLGVNNIMVDKKERLVSDEANSNNELINLNLQSFLAPRKEACRLFNEYFNLEGDNKIDVRVRSDLHNIIKNEESVIKDYNVNIEKGDVNNG